MRITIVGVGAVGGVLGGLLARAGHDLRFVAQGESLAVLRAVGLSITTPDGAFSTGPLAASTDPSELGACDLVVVAVKSWQVEPLASSLAPLLDANTLVLPMQNGVEAADHLERALGSAHVLGSSCHALASRQGPARASYVGPAPAVTLGERHGPTSERSRAVGDTLRAAGISVTLTEDVRVALWSKLLFVEPLGSVGAVTAASAGVLRVIPETRAMLLLAMREVRSVAIALGANVPEEAVAQALGRVDALPPDATASMHRDLLEGRPSELNEQTGAVVRLGEAASVARPVHDFLLASLLPRERKARG